MLRSDKRMLQGNKGEGKALERGFNAKKSGAINLSAPQGPAQNEQAADGRKL